MFNITKRSTPRRKLVNTAAVTLALAGGGVVGAVVGAPLISSAQDDDTPPTTTAATTADDPTEGTTEDTTPSDDTDDATECGPGFRMHGPGHLFGPGARLDTIAESLGIEREELTDALRDGQTIAEIAEEQGIPTEEVIDDLVAEAEARIDEAVADGDLDAEDAADLESDVRERITDFVNGELPDLDEMRPPHMRERFFDEGDGWWGRDRETENSETENSETETSEAD